MALSKEFYLDEIRSKYPNSYNESLKDLPVKDLEDMLDFLDQALEKADGGSIGIEVLFGPKRDEFSIGGRARPTDRVYDSRANVEDFTKALKRVSAGTTYQQQADAQRYARNKANEMLTSAMRSGNQSGIQSIFQGVGGPTSMGGMQFNRSGNRITSVPATGPGRDKIINAMAQEMLKYTPSYQSLKPQPRDNLGLLMQDTIITDQMKSPAEMEAIRQKVLAAQKAQEQSSFMTDPVTGKKYSSEAEAIDDLGLVTYNQRFADGGRVGLFMGGPALTGTALDIYNSMKAYGFPDEEIANALRARGLYDTTPAPTATAQPLQPNITRPNGGGKDENDNGGVKDPRSGLGFSTANFGLGPAQDVMDYEADAAKVGRTVRGQFAKARVGIGNLISKMRSLPTPLNIALNLAQGIGGMFSPSNRATREAIAKDIARDKQGEISTVDLRGRANLADTYSKIGRTRDAPGGGGTTSGPTGEEGFGGFCFDPNTLVQMADGSEKKIKEIQLGDQTKGGEVTGVFQFKASDEIHDYKGVVVAGSHYVKEDGKFIMVQDSPISVKIDKIPVVYSLDTTGRRIFINDIEFADYNGDGVAKNFLTNAGVDLTGFDTEVLRQVEQRLI